MIAKKRLPDKSTKSMKQGTANLKEVLIIVINSKKGRPLSSEQILVLKKKTPARFGLCRASRAGGSRPFSEVNARAWSPRSLHGSSEEHPHNLCCRTHGYSITAPGDFVHGHGGPSAGAVTGHFPAFGRDMRNRFLLFPTKTTGSSRGPTVSRSVSQEERVPRSCTKDLYSVTTPWQTLQIITCLIGFIETGESFIIR
ncbi:hypothetical protein PoB_006473500 [Plakobranchus ocellatus]|uniref:Uncharacterized protein n=1 Tax=Plakobranchus ocellatus TaxID=259542 RepID=A0AAV4D2B0_9GAST|nr:hypothetical protein PoB_006473500 [Plakobranchus ocellatus]